VQCQSIIYVTASVESINHQNRLLACHLIFDLQLKFEEAKNTDCSENRHGTLTLARHSKGQQGGGREVHDSPGAGHRRRRLRASVRPRRWEGLGAAAGRVAVYAAAFSRDGEEAGTGKRSLGAARWGRCVRHSWA
jgi:hypothetical protein